MLELPDVAQELYGIVPAEFTAARVARAKAARSDKNPVLGNAIAALPKPSVAAAVVNQLMRHRADQLEQLFQLGAQLRAAQEGLDRRQLQRLGRARQELVGAIAQDGRAVAEELGMKVSGSAVGEVEQTLQAAMADPQAEAAVRTGCLTHSLASTGLEPVDVSHAVAIPLTDAQASSTPSRPSTAKKSGSSTGGSANDAPATEREGSAEAKATEARKKAAAQRASDARQAADEAARRSDEAESRLADLEQRIDDLIPRRNELDDQLAELEHRIAETRAGIAALGRDADRLERERATAAERVETALARERRARERLEALE